MRICLCFFLVGWGRGSSSDDLKNAGDEGERRKAGCLTCLLIVMGYWFVV